MGPTQRLSLPISRDVNTQNDAILCATRLLAHLLSPLNLQVRFLGDQTPTT